MKPTRAALPRCRGAMTSDGFATHASAMMLSSPGKEHPLPEGLRRNLILNRIALAGVSSIQTGNRAGQGDVRA